MRLRCYVLERDVDCMLYVRWDVRRIGIVRIRSLNGLLRLVRLLRLFILSLLLVLLLRVMVHRLRHYASKPNEREEALYM